MICRFQLNSLGEFVAWNFSRAMRNRREYLMGTYIASSNFFSAKALLPSAFSASAMMVAAQILIDIDVCMWSKD